MFPGSKYLKQKILDFFKCSWYKDQICYYNTVGPGLEYVLGY